MYAMVYSTTSTPVTTVYRPPTYAEGRSPVPPLRPSGDREGEHQSSPWNAGWTEGQGPVRGRR